jgi:hypothetical protein
MTVAFVIVGPNPFGSGHWPAAMQLHFGNFIYFFVLLSGATLIARLNCLSASEGDCRLSPAKPISRIRYPTGDCT